RFEERVELGAVGVGEALAEVPREPRAVSRSQNAARIAHEDGSLGSDDLAADVVPERAGARDVRDREAAVLEADRDERVVEVAERLELGMDERLAGGADLDRFPAEQ